MAIINLEEQAKKKSNIPTLTVGTYQAVISGIWPLGLQEGTYENVTTIKDKLLFRFEINETIEAEGDYNGMRYCIYKEINIPDFFGDKSALVIVMSAVEGKQLTKDYFKAFDTDTVIGKNIMVSTGLTSGGNAKITTFSPKMKALPDIETELTTEVPNWVKTKQDSAIQPDQVEQVQANADVVSAPLPRDDLPF